MSGAVIPRSRELETPTHDSGIPNPAVSFSASALESGQVPRGALATVPTAHTLNSTGTANSGFRRKPEFARHRIEGQQR